MSKGSCTNSALSILKEILFARLCRVEEKMAFSTCKDYHQPRVHTNLARSAKLLQSNTGDWNCQGFGNLLSQVGQVLQKLNVARQ